MLERFELIRFDGHLSLIKKTVGRVSAKNLPLSKYKRRMHSYANLSAFYLRLKFK